jgi:ABC-type branched-subunit amino acid transport system substrate-binding protein
MSFTMLGRLTVAAGLIAASGTIAWAEDGVTPNEILLGGTNASTGAIAAACGPEVQGALAYFKLINDAGGVNGRHIRYEVLDDAYSAQRATGNIRRLTQQDKVFAVFNGCGTATAAAALSALERTDIPYLFPYAGLDRLVEPPKPTIFSLLPQYSSQLAAIIPHIIAESKPQTAALFSFNIAGHEAVRAAARQALERGGVRVLADTLMEVTSPDRASFALQARNLNPDLLIINDSSPGAARFVLELQRQNWKPHVITGVSTLTDDSFLRAVSGAADGLVVAPGMVLPPTAPGAQECVRALSAFDAKVTPSHYSMFGCLSARVFVEALRRIKGDPTRAGLVAALDGMRDLETGISGGITFTPERRMGLQSVYVFRVKDGKFTVDDKPLKLGQ